MENNNANQNASNLNPQEDILELDLDTASPEQVKEFASATKEKNKQLYERAKKAETDKKELAEALKKATPAKSEPSQITNDDKFEQLKLIAKGYAEDEIDFIQKNGGAKALDNPFIKAAIDSIRTQRKAEEAANLDSKSTSDISRQYTPEQFAKLSAKKQEEILTQMQ